MIEEWKRLSVERQSGRSAVSRVDFAADLADVWKHLHREGRHGEEDLLEVMRSAAREAGYSGEEVDKLLRAILAEASTKRR
jgi:hypothetical protein